MPSVFPQYMRFRWAVQDFLSRGEKPTPTALGNVDPSFVNRNHGKITLSHGRLAAIRREEFLRYGWRYVSRDGLAWDSDVHGANGRWIPPQKKR